MKKIIFWLGTYGTFEQDFRVDVYEQDSAQAENCGLNYYHNKW